VLVLVTVEVTAWPEPRVVVDVIVDVMVDPLVFEVTA
jgi:hypothetical protein